MSEYWRESPSFEEMNEYFKKEKKSMPKTSHTPNYKDFTDFLNDKFYAEHPTTLDNEWPDLYSDWLSDQDSDTLVKYADEFAQAQVKQALAKAGKE